MIYQSNTGKLYLLLSSCVPQNTIVQARLFDEEIKQSADYQHLYRDPQGKVILHQILHQNEGEAVTASVKDKRLQAMSLASSLLDELPKAIQTREVSLLTQADRPDFASPASLQQLVKKIGSLPKGHTHTNLTTQDSLLIFAPETIRSSAMILPELTPSQLEKAAQALPAALNGHPYCIAQSTLQAEVAQMQRLLDESGSYLILERRAKHRRRLVKWTLLLLVITIFLCTYILHLMPQREACYFLFAALLVTGLLMIAG